jgi:beta-aspartyl-peptidase (threonine type)
MRPRLIVHGGAWNIPDHLVADHIAGVKKALELVYPALQKGMSALDAVEKAVNIMEEDPTFDAGRGAFLNEHGEIELDAMIMDGATLNFGAVAAVQNILHPVSLARKVMEETEHCFLVGNGAQHFARKMNIPELDPAELLTERELIFYNMIKHDPTFHTRKPFDAERMGTVGAAVLDISGNLAAATSTGGTPRKLSGRVGDTSIVGAGTYADNLSGAVSATGWGESILKVLLSKTVCDLFREYGAMESAQKSIQLLKQRVNGLGGIIGINSRGDYAFAHNTPKMAFAYADGAGRVIADIKLK